MKTEWERTKETLIEHYEGVMQLLSDARESVIKNQNEIPEELKENKPTLLLEAYYGSVNTLLNDRITKLKKMTQNGDSGKEVEP